MLVRNNNPEIGAYFYPITTRCPVRQNRAVLLGAELTREPRLAQNAPPRFESHAQPKTYCLGDDKSTDWDDSDMSSMDRQIGLARDYGLKFWIFDTYTRRINGKIVKEAYAPLDETFLRLDSAGKMKFGLMHILGGVSRVVLPVKPGFVEQNRYHVIDLETSRMFIDECIKKYWSRENYLTINGRPYISVYTMFREPAEKIKTVVEDMHNYAHNQYGVDPYIAGVVSEFYGAVDYKHAGVDALTGYGWLADFKPDALPVQNYLELLQRRIKEWEDGLCLGIPVVPPAVVGWDASPRFDPGYTPSDLDVIKRNTGCNAVYPLVPIVEGTIADFKEMLRATTGFIIEHVSEKERYQVICAWNEITEGAALLPQVINGQVDFSYLEAVREYVYAEKSNRKF